MAIELDFEVLELETREAFHIARREAPPTWRSVWVRLRDGEGREGWGEAPTTTPYYGETAETATALLPRLGEAVAEAEAGGGDVDSVQRIEDALRAAVGRNPAAHAGVSAALHDLLGKRLDAPVWRLWGLDPAAAPPSSFTIGIDEPEAMRRKVREAASYPVLKVKVGTERDEEVLRLIRDEAPDARLWVDANTAWSVKEALRRLPMLEEYDVELLEQPVAPDDLAGLGLLRTQARLPIIADESCRTASDIPRLADHVDGINVKLAKCGSLQEAMKMIHAARAENMRVMLGCMIESTLGIAAAVQLAPLVDYADLDGAALLANDPFTGPGLEGDGTLRFNEGAGLGVELGSWGDGVMG